MNATPRFRLFDSNRRGNNNGDPEQGAPQTLLPVPRMMTSVSVARARRRNRRRPGAPHRDVTLVPRLLSLSRVTSTSSRRRAVLLLLLAVCGAVTFFSAKLLSWASRSFSSSPRPRPRPPSHVVSSGDDDVDPRRNPHRPLSGVSLGPDAIPSVVLVERRPGGVRKASSLDGQGGAPSGGGMGAMQDDDDHPGRCRNTVQGTTLLADSEGRVCRRTDLDIHHRPGCCAAARPPPVLLTRETGGIRGRNDALVPGKKESHFFFGRGVLSSDSATSTAARGRDGEPMGLPPVGGIGATAATTARQPGGSGGDDDDGFPPELELLTPFSCWSCDEGEEHGAESSNRDGHGDGHGDGNGSGSGSYSSCCRSYEFCVSCCQAPWRKKEREAIRAAEALSGHPVYRELGFSNNNDVDSSSVGWGGRKKAVTHRPRDTGNELRRESYEEGKGPAEVRRAQEAAFAHCAFRCRTYSGSVAHENSYRSPLKHCFGRYRPPVVAAPGIMPVVGIQGGGGRLGGGREGVENDGGEGALPPLQLDPFLTDLMEA